MSNIVIFDNQEIELVNFGGELYMTLPQIEGALGFTNSGKAISNLYNNHKSEFTPEMTRLIAKGRTRVRIFNREGAWLIGMFARTPKAAEFRKWVLKTLGDVADSRLSYDQGLKDWCAGAITQLIEAQAQKMAEDKFNAYAKEAKSVLEKHTSKPPLKVFIENEVKKLLAQ